MLYIASFVMHYYDRINIDPSIMAMVFKHLYIMLHLIFLYFHLTLILYDFQLLCNVSKCHWEINERKKNKCTRAPQISQRVRKKCELILIWCINQWKYFCAIFVSTLCACHSLSLFFVCCLSWFYIHALMPASIILFLLLAVFILSFW